MSPANPNPTSVRTEPNPKSPYKPKGLAKSASSAPNPETPRKNNRGGHNKIFVTQTQLQTLCSHINKCLSVDDACILAGISRNTYTALFKRDKVFANEVSKAVVLSKARLLESLSESVDQPQWQRKAWLLERVHGFIPQSKSEVTNKGNTLSIAKPLLDKISSKGDQALAKVIPLQSQQA